jgi:hypothetical protein
MGGLVYHDWCKQDAMARARVSVAVTLLVVSSASGCCRSGSQGARPPPERFLGSDAPLSLVLPSLREAAASARSLLDTAGSIPATSGLSEWMTGLSGQLGFGLLDPAGLSSAGIDPDGGAAACLGCSPPLLVLPVSDAGKLDTTVRRLARDRLDAQRRETVRASGGELVTFSRAPGGPVSVAYLVRDGLALLAAGPTSPDVVKAAAALPQERSLAASSAWRSARSAMGEGLTALAFAPPGASQPSRLSGALGQALLRDGAAIGLQAAGDRVRVRTALLLTSSGRADYWRALIRNPPSPADPAAASQAGRDALARLPPRSSLAVRWGGDLTSLGARLVPSLPAWMARRLAAAGLDPTKDLFSNLAPGAALAISLAPTFTVADLNASRTAPEELSVLRALSLRLEAQVRDADQARALFQRLVKAGPALGAQMGSWPLEGGGGGATGWSAAFPGGALVWTLTGDRLSVWSAAEARATAPKGGYVPPTESARAAIDGGVAGAVLDLGALSGSVQALPSEAFGSGPDRFVVRSLVDRYLDPATRMQAASLRFDLAGDAALFDLVVELRPQERRAP